MDGLNMTKTKIAKQLLDSGKTKDALKIFRTFKFGITKEQSKQIARASEMLNGNERFYNQLGFNKEVEVNKAIEICKEFLWKE
jgi:hypothetical protein